MSDLELPASREARRRILRRIVLSLAVGAMAYSLTELSGVDQVWSLTLSVFIGGVSMVVQLLIDVEARLARVETGTERHSTKIENDVETGFAKISEATELFSLVEASALRTDAVTQLVRHATLIQPDANPLVSRFAQAEIGRVSAFLKELGEAGSVVYEGEDRDWLLTLAREVETSIDATSLTTVDAGGGGFTGGGFWTRDLGQRYLDCQRDAVQRGVRIRRLFVILRADQVGDAGLEEICRLQKDVGIEVRVLYPQTIPTIPRALFDCVLFDEVISYEATAASSVEGMDAPTIINTRLELRQDRVRTRIQYFKELWEHGQAPA